MKLDPAVLSVGTPALFVSLHSLWQDGPLAYTCVVRRGGVCQGPRELLTYVLRVQYVTEKYTPPACRQPQARAPPHDAPQYRNNKRKVNGTNYLLRVP